MNASYITIIAVLILTVICTADDRQMSQDEIMHILRDLAGKQKRTWIAQGTIEARHVEFQACPMSDSSVQTSRGNSSQQALLSSETDGCTTESTELVRYDGDRFYWAINIHSRREAPGFRNKSSTRPARQFDLASNRNRVFAWDGQTYTIYSSSAAYAMVDAAETIPHGINGPLTAGIIPWGYGQYSMESSTVAERDAVEQNRGGEHKIQLTLIGIDGRQDSLVLDPARDYAVKSHIVKQPAKPIHSNHYSDYRQIAGTWIPGTILMEEYDPDTDRLLGYDLWTLTRIDTESPEIDAFEVNCEDDTIVEFFSPLDGRPLMYRMNSMTDTQALLTERLVSGASKSPRNCATLCAGYVASRLGVQLDESELGGLMETPQASTNMASLKQFLEKKGLACRAVKTDIETLRELSDCFVILHYPGKNHFVVLHHIDNKRVWTIDLLSRRFFASTDVQSFDKDWSDGVTLLVSHKPVTSRIVGTDIPSRQLDSIRGGAGYSCTRVLQISHVVPCPSTPCEGSYFQYYYERCKCEAAESGSCSGTMLPRFMEVLCKEDAYWPGHCVTLGPWTQYYMVSCEGYCYESE